MNDCDKIIGKLRAEHREIQALLGLYIDEPVNAIRVHLLSQICQLVRFHCALEAGVVVAAVAKATNDSDLLKRTGAAYASVMGMINELAAENGSGLCEQQRVSELSRHINTHIAAAESDKGFFTQAPLLALDWKAIERELAQKRAKFHG